jgi:hypothetical protein
MPIVKVPFGEWLPDQGDLGNPGATVATNVIPDTGLFRPFYGLSPSAGTAISAYARGAISASGSDGFYYNFAGDETKLYSRSSAATSSAMVDVSRTSGAYATSETNRWDFAKYGEKIIATNYDDEPQVITFGDTNFIDLPGSPPKAKTVAVIGDFVVLGNLDESGTKNVQKVKWSGFGDETAWAPSPTTQSDEQILEGNYGSILRIVGGDFGSIFCERGIIRMEREGPPTVFGFYPAERKRGAISAGAICDAGSVMFYISNDDIYVFNGSESQNIGAGKVARTILDDLDPSFHHRMTSAADITRSLAMWSYAGSGNNNGQPNKILIYHWPSGSWSIAEVETNALYGYMSPGYTLEGLDEISTSLDALGASLDSVTWQGGNLGIGAFSASNVPSTFNGNALTAVVETKEFEASSGLAALVDQTRPLIEGDSATITVQHGTRARQSQNTTWGSSVSVNDDGAFDVRRSARYHRLRFTISGGFTKALGADVRIKPNGKR